MSVDIDVKRKITVDGKDYDSLDQLPAEVQTAILKTLASRPANSKTTFHINGKSYSSVEDLPAPLRGLVATVATLVLESRLGMARETERVPGTIRPAPVLSLKKLILLIGVIALIVWLFGRLG